MCKSGASTNAYTWLISEVISLFMQHGVNFLHAPFYRTVLKIPAKWCKVCLYFLFLSNRWCYQQL